MQMSDSCSVCAKTPATLRCSRCKDTLYCSEDCQRTAWPAHKGTCAPPTESAPVPIDPIAVPEGIEEEVERMRVLIEEVGVLQKQYMQARKGAAAGSDQATPKTYLDDARAKLAAFAVSPGFEFTPASPHPHMQTLLSICRTFFIWTVAFLDDGERTSLAFMLDNTPPHGRRVPKFNGRKVVGAPGACSSRVYEGLFRTLHLIVFQIPGMERSEEAKLWRMFPESAVLLWEED